MLTRYWGFTKLKIYVRKIQAAKPRPKSAFVLKLFYNQPPAKLNFTLGQILGPEGKTKPAIWPE